MIKGKWLFLMFFALFAFISFEGQAKITNTNCFLNITHFRADGRVVTQQKAGGQNQATQRQIAGQAGGVGGRLAKRSCQSHCEVTEREARVLLDHGETIQVECVFAREVLYRNRHNRAALPTVIRQQERE